MQQKHIEDLFEEKARSGEGSYAIAYALLRLAEAQKDSAIALKDLGLADAATPMGAIEFLSREIRDTGRSIADAISELQSS